MLNKRATLGKVYSQKARKLICSTVIGYYHLIYHEERVAPKDRACTEVIYLVAHYSNQCTQYIVCHSQTLSALGLIAFNISTRTGAYTESDKALCGKSLATTDYLVHGYNIVLYWQITVQEHIAISLSITPYPNLNITCVC